MLKFSPTYLLLCLLCVISFRSDAQYNEMGFWLGAANYKGDLSPHIINTDFLHPAVGIFYRHNWDRHWSWKAELNYGRISGDDAEANNGFELDRNLSFRSDILEFSPQIEFNFFPYETGNPQYAFTPFVFTGISFFHFNPKAELNGEVYELQPMGTEGQELNGEKLYKRVQFALPIGGGVKISTGRLGIGIEVGARRTYSDYLDDVSTTYPNMPQLLAARGPVAVALSDRSFSGTDTSSTIPDVFHKQRGNSQDKDWFLFAGITFSYRMTSMQKDNCRPFKRRRY